MKELKEDEQPYQTIRILSLIGAVGIFMLILYLIKVLFMPILLPLYMHQVINLVMIFGGATGILGIGCIMEWVLMKSTYLRGLS